MKFCLTFAATVLLGAISLEAHAQQPWLADRRYGEGIGVRVGDLELHPGVSGEVGYDSNYFLRAPSESPLAAYRLRITPSISLATLGPQRRDNGPSTAVRAPLTFRGGAYASFNELIAADSAHSSEFSNQRHLDLGGDLVLNVFPQGRVGTDAYVNAVRMVQPSNDTDTENAFNRDTLRFGAGATWRPGGGLFDWRLGYEGTYNYFEKSNFSYLNNFQHQANMRGRWRFLPRTALLYDGSYTWVDYSDNRTTQRDGAIVRSRIGMNGLITTRWSLLAMVGWAGTFYNSKGAEAPQQFDSLTGQVELKWFISGGQESMASSAPVGLSYASLGYTRDVGNSYLGNFYQKDRGYVGISYLLGGVFVTSLSAGIANLKFPQSYFVGGGVQHQSFSVQRVDASWFSEYRLSNIFGLNATVNYDQNITDVSLPASPTDTVGDELKYSRWQVFLGARVFW
ncbi:MAG: hypothetical protein ABIQ16_09275 [Polyangiaceae bacterium]